MKVISEMGLLADVDLKRLAKEGRIISPFEKEMLSGGSYDLRVGSKLTSRNRLSSFDLTKGSYVVESGECVTIETLDVINLRDFAAFGVVANKHTIAATGLFHPITTIDPGFNGPLALTLFNLGNVRYTIRAGDKIAKVFFHPIGAVPNNVYGVSQRPTYREGATAVALLVDQPQHRDDNNELAKMYGAPIRKLYEQMERLSGNIELFALRRDRARRDRIVGWIIAAVTGAACAVLTNFIRENWATISALFS